MPRDPRVLGRRHAGPGAGARRHQVRGRQSKTQKCATRACCKRKAGTGPRRSVWCRNRVTGVLGFLSPLPPPAPNVVSAIQFFAPGRKDQKVLGPGLTPGMQIWESQACFLGPLLSISHFYSLGEARASGRELLQRERKQWAVLFWEARPRFLAPGPRGLVPTRTGKGKPGVFSVTPRKGQDRGRDGIHRRPRNSVLWRPGRKADRYFSV